MTALHRQRQCATERLNQVRLVEMALVLFGLPSRAGGTFRTLLASGADDREASSILFQLVTLFASSPARPFLVFERCPAWVLHLVKASWPILALTGLALLSTAWSDSPSTTFRRAIALVLTTGFAFFVVARFEREGIHPDPCRGFRIVLPGFDRRCGHSGARHHPHGSA